MNCKHLHIIYFRKFADTTFAVLVHTKHIVHFVDIKITLCKLKRSHFITCARGARPFLIAAAFSTEKATICFTLHWKYEFSAKKQDTTTFEMCTLTREKKFQRKRTHGIEENASICMSVMCVNVERALPSPLFSIKCTSHRNYWMRNSCCRHSLENRSTGNGLSQRWDEIINTND